MPDVCKNYQIKNFKINTKVGDKNSISALTVDSLRSTGRIFYLFVNHTCSIKFLILQKRNEGATSALRYVTALTRGQARGKQNESVLLREHPRRER